MNKTKISDLAVCGGAPLFQEVLHVGRPNFCDRERFLRRMEEILDRGRLTNHGPFVQEFEERVAALCEVKHCIAMTNGTIGLEIAARALGLSGEVILPSFTFIATAHCLQWLGITPVFCDIDPSTHNIDPGKIEELITPETTGILPVHLWGRPCPVEALQEIANRRSLKVLYDASHAFGNSYRGKTIGNFGDMEVFSFHATKFINCFEGGAVVTNNDKLAEKLRLMKNFGFRGLDLVVHLGVNGKMSEASAAMGLSSLDRMDEIVAANRANYENYGNQLLPIPGITMVEYDPEERNNYQYVVLEIEQEAFGVSRDELISILHAENVRARRYFFPGCHRMEPYVSNYPTASNRLPETEKVAGRTICLPTGTSVGQMEIDTICQFLRFLGENAAIVVNQIASRA